MPNVIDDLILTFLLLYVLAFIWLILYGFFVWVSEGDTPDTNPASRKSMEWIDEWQATREKPAERPA